MAERERELIELILFLHFMISLILSDSVLTDVGVRVRQQWWKCRKEGRLQGGTIKF